ncbi:AraC family transcriptional regulator [Nevskia sp.]|uniref:AraC family transcriptional regulator n=1 Tax=Nevskia sp. TaxID=1929292 RepID=UPI0026012E69|nr:AraC family transcriptional regulator [Nevskia sp.]
MAEGVFVWSGLAELLLGYLDACKIALPALRQTLAQHRNSQRMPIAIWWSALEDIAQAQGVPAVGLRIGQHFKIHHFGVLGYLVASCDTLEQALMRFQRFQPLLHNLTPTLANQQARDMQLSWDPSYGRSTRLSNEVLAASLLQLARTLTSDHSLKPAAVDFPEPAPGDVAVYEALLGCPVRFKAKTLIVHFPLDALALPINSSDPHLRVLLDQQAEALLQVLPQADSFLARLQHQIVKALQEGEPAAEQVAVRLQLPTRTLYRRLEERNLSYKGLLSQLRFQLAKKYLADPRIPLSDAALLLGYSEQSAFTRAFKSWCGQTPLHFRKAWIRMQTR